MSGSDLPPAMGAKELDRLGHTIISLAKELWVTRDRLRVLEWRLAELGIDVDLDRYQPPSELVETLATERSEFVETLLSTLSGKSVDSEDRDV